jgi:hypothetical protein
MQTKCTLTTFLLVIVSLFSYGRANTTNKLSPTSSGLRFIANVGQVTDQHYQPRTDIDFRIGGNGVNLFVGSRALHYQWVQPAGTKVIAGDTLQEYNTYRMDVQLVGANPNAKVVKEQKQGFYERYYTPQFGEQGGIAYAYQKVTYKEVYPNIDWVLYVKNNTVEYDFVVHPGGNVADIQLQYDGAISLKVNTDGSLTATTPMGSITEAAPISYQQADGKPVASFFKQENNTVSFATGDYYGTLVIDPTLSWATYYGGTGAETIRMGCTAGDNQGNVFFAGTTGSTSNIATVGSYQDTITGSTDVFIVKMNSSGVRQWATYYGGSGAENTYGIACDTFGNAFLSGYTASSSAIATSGAHQTTIGGSTDAFLVKFDTAGTRQWATYYGGSAAEQGLAVCTDISGNVFLTGYTQSTSAIATTGGYQSSNAGGQDAFIVKFNPAGSRQWATYYGGSSTDQGLGVTCDLNKNVFLTGYTQSTLGIATSGSHQTTYGGGQDAYLAKFDSTGVIQWATYYGGTGLERAYSLTCGETGDIYMTGETTSTTMIASTGSFQDTYGGGAADAFLVRFNSNGIRLWATYYGHNGNDIGYGLTRSPLSDIYMTGRTSSTSNIAVSGTFQDTLNGTGDAMLIKFDTSGARIWGTYFGGEGSDIGYGVFCNNLSKVFVAGTTASYSGIATSGAHQTTYGGGTFDGFIAKFDDCLLMAPATISGDDTICRNGSYTYTVLPVTGATSYTWTLPAGFTGSSTTNTISITAGTSSDTIKVAANFLCGTSITIDKPVYVSPLPTINPIGIIKVCAGDSATFTASIGTAYQWLQAGTPISGATNATYTAHTANTYAVVVTNTNGCTDTSLLDTLIVNPLPIPLITASGTVLSTGTYTTYQWNRNGTPITGAVSPTYTIVVASGDYTVTVTDSNGCSGTSAIYSPTTGIHETGTEKYVRIYPNPATDWLYIDAKVPVTVSVSTIEGKLLIDRSAQKKISIADLPAGLYLLRFYDKNTGVLLFTEKLVTTINNR